MSDASQPPGPRRPPRPSGAPSAPPGPRRPPAARPPKGSGSPAAPTARPQKSKIPEAPGPRPDRPRRQERPRPSDQGPPSTTVRFRKPVPAPAAAPAASAPARPTADDAHRESHTGRLRRVRAERQAAEALLPPAEANLSPFRRRYGVPYDTQGPKVRLGVLWALVVVAALYPQSLRPWGLAVLYGVVAGLAAAQVIDAHRGDRASVDRAVAAFGGSALAIAATLGAGALGAGYLLLVVAAVGGVLAAPETGRPVLARAGRVVGAAGVCGGAAASLVLLAEYEIGALIILLVLVMVYDASDFIVGSGASNGIEGPLAGALFMAGITAVFAALNVPPFRGVDIWSFSVLAMIACPAGQILASGMLPAASVRAPALRRLDSLLVVAPAWAGLVGLYLLKAAA